MISAVTCRATASQLRAVPRAVVAQRLGEYATAQLRAVTPFPTAQQPRDTALPLVRRSVTTGRNQPALGNRLGREGDAICDVSSIRLGTGTSLVATLVLFRVISGGRRSAGQSRKTRPRGAASATATSCWRRRQPPAGCSVPTEGRSKVKPSVQYSLHRKAWGK